MHPISTIPLETLLHILLFLHHSVDRTAIEAPENPLGAVRLVCRLWDTAVTETTVFWTTIRIGQKTNPDDIEWSTLFALHFKRSNNLPLDLVLQGQHAKSYVFDVLVEHVTRWRSVVMRDSARDGDVWDAIDPADLFRNLEMPNVATIHIDSDRAHPPETVIKAPKLQRLVWNYGGVTFPAGPPPLQSIILQKFDQPDEYDTGNLSIQDLFLCQNTLQELSFNPLAKPRAYSQLEQPTFSQLHTLRLDGVNGFWLRFMRHCHFPHLHTFGIELEISQQPPSNMPIWSSVRRLEWRSYYKSSYGRYYSLRKQSAPGLLGPFLTSCPNITAISFAGDPKVGDDAELLVLAEGEEVYCPKLEKIELESCGLEVLECLTARRPSLKTIWMKEWPKDKPDTEYNTASDILLGLIQSRVRFLVQSEKN